jgi:hypothetical protein
VRRCLNRTTVRKPNHGSIVRAPARARQGLPIMRPWAPRSGNGRRSATSPPC